LAAIAVDAIAVFFMPNELIEFAKRYYPGFGELPERFIRTLFETYKNTTLVWYNNGEIRGFAVYQDWPELANFFLICGIGTQAENLKMLRTWARNFVKKVVWFDEKKMKLRIICHR